MILYPTETLYALGANALSEADLEQLHNLKEREAGKVASWLVRTVGDIQNYAEFPEKAVKIAEEFLPGSLTLILRAKESVSESVTASDHTIGFRISTDKIAKKVIADFIQKYDAPLTCTSANISGSPTLSTPSEIRQQFGANASMITEIIDDGPRKGLASTVVRVIGDEVTVLREGEVSEKDILSVLK